MSIQKAKVGPKEDYKAAYHKRGERCLAHHGLTAVVPIAPTSMSHNAVRDVFQHSTTISSHFTHDAMHIMSYRSQAAPSVLFIVTHVPAPCAATMLRIDIQKMY